MANEIRQQARQLWEQSSGTLPLKEIAQQLKVSLGTVKSWKHRDAWGMPDAPQKLQEVATKDATAQAQRRRRAQVNRAAAESIEANEELTDSEKEFCAAFVHAPSATQAAQATGRYSTYASAKQMAYSMLQKPAVVAEIKRLKAIKRMALLADGDDVIDMHMRIAFADITQFVEFGRTEVEVMGPFGPIMVQGPDGKPVALKKEINTVRFKEHTQVDGLVLAEVKQGRDGASVKLADRQKSLDFLAQYFLLNPLDKHRIEYDERRMKLDERKAAEGNEEALSKLDELMAGVDRVMQDGN